MENSGRSLAQGWWLVAVSVILGVSFVAGTYIIAQTVDYVKTLDSSLITVTGSAQKTIVSDDVKWTGSFSRQTPAKDLKAGSDQMKKDLALVQAYLAKSGVSPSDETVMPVVIMPVYNNCFIASKLGNAASGCVNEIVDYRLTQTIVVDSKNVQQISKLAQDTSPLIDQGVVFSTQRLEYLYTQLASLRVQMLAAATKDAQTRAQQIAQTTGVHLGRLESVSSGVFQITPVNSVQVSNQGSYDTSTIDKEVTAVERASFTLGQ